jgi:hypothetical protein
VGRLRRPTPPRLGCFNKRESLTEGAMPMAQRICMQLDL